MSVLVASSSSVANGTYNLSFKASNSDYTVLAYAKYIIDAIAPTVPSNLTASISGSKRKQAINLAWSASSDSGSGVSHYRVIRNNSLLSTTTNLTYKDSSAADNTLYTYVIQAVDKAGNISSSSNSQSISKASSGGGGSGGKGGGKGRKK